MRCRYCGCAIFWAFYADRYLHTTSKGAQCRPGRDSRVAAPKGSR